MTNMSSSTNQTTIYAYGTISQYQYLFSSLVTNSFGIADCESQINVLQTFLFNRLFSSFSRKHKIPSSTVKFGLLRLVDLTYIATIKNLIIDKQLAELEP